MAMAVLLYTKRLSLRLVHPDDLMEKAGMQREGRKRKALPLKSGCADNYFYAILKEEWLNVR